MRGKAAKAFERRSASVLLLKFAQKQNVVGREITAGWLEDW